ERGSDEENLCSRIVEGKQSMPLAAWRQAASGEWILRRGVREILIGGGDSPNHSLFRGPILAGLDERRQPGDIGGPVQILLVVTLHQELVCFRAADEQRSQRAPREPSGGCL